LSISLSFACSHFLEKGRIVDTQTHNCHELVFYDRGCNGIATIDGVNHKISDGDVLVCRKSVPHSETHFSDVECFFFGFDCDEEIENGVYHDLRSIKPVIESIIQESIEQKYGYEEIIDLKIREILLLLKRSINSSEYGNKTKSLFYCKNYIDENYMEKINISYLAKMTGYSLDHFRHLFYQNFGMSPNKYITQKRCEKAIELLTSTSYKCVDIAYKCGFFDSSQMTKTLKKHYRKTPQQIREQK